MTPLRHVHLPKALAAFVQVQAGAPEERCGLLLGTWVQNCAMIDEVLAAPNISKTPTNSFEIDPAIRLKAQRTAREKGRAVLGLYHTHPNGTTQASTKDHAGAQHEPGLVWVIATQTACATYVANDEGLIDSHPPSR